MDRRTTDMGSAGVRQSDKHNRQGGSTLASGTGSYERVRTAPSFSSTMPRSHAVVNGEL